MIIVVLALIGIGGWFFLQTPATETPLDSEVQTPIDTSVSTKDTETTTTDVNGADTGTKIGNDTGMDSTGEALFDVPDVVVNIAGSNFAFSQKEIRVKGGDIVQVNFSSSGGMHDWVIDEFAGAKTPRLQSGQNTSITFIANKKGTFEYYCSVGNHRQMGMVGKLIVE